MSAYVKTIGNHAAVCSGNQPGAAVQQDKAARLNGSLDAYSGRHSLVAYSAEGAHTAISRLAFHLACPRGSIACESITYPGLAASLRTRGANCTGASDESA